VEPAHTDLIQRFMLGAKDLSVSIVLVGSHAIRRAHEGSDVDLIVIAKGGREAEAIRTVADRLSRTGIRQVLDCKVYTELEFSRAKSGRENRFLWTCLVNGKVLSGRDITREVKLLPRVVKDSYWVHVQEVEDACDRLSAGVQFTGSCYHIYDALVTTYFVERFILNVTGPALTKGDFVHSYLGDQHEKAHERYYWVAGHIRTDTFNTLRVAASVDNRFGRKDYARMYEKGLSILRLLRTMSARLTEWADSAD